MIMKLLALFSILIGFQLSAQTTWYEIPSGTDTTLNTISFGSNMVGYIGGNDSLLLKTTDGGLTWNSVNYSGVTFLPGGERIINLNFLNETTGYMTVGPYTGTYRTTDGGQTWTQVNLPGNMCYNQGIYFWDASNGIIGGSGCFQGELLGKMTNGTVNLSTISSTIPSSPSIIKDVDFADNNFGIAVSDRRFFRTTDGGQNWDTVNPGTSFDLTSVTVVNDTLAFAGYIDASSSGFGVLTTHDAGLTWSMEMSMATFYYPDYNDVYHTSSDFIYSGGETDFQGKGIMFENNGSSWIYAEVDYPIQAIGGYDDIVFAVGDSGSIVTNNNFGGTLHSKTWSDKKDDFKVYPNPAEDVISIEFSSESTVQKINIFNMYGQIVKSYSKSIKKYTVSDLPSGVYLIEVQSEEKIMTQKLIKK